MAFTGPTGGIRLPTPTLSGVFKIEGIEKDGVFDFLSGHSRLESVAGGHIDLERDAQVAGELRRLAPSLSAAELNQHVGEIHSSGCCSRAVLRFNRRYAKVEASVGMAHGRAVLNKVNPYLAAHSLPAVGGKLGLECAGGIGMLLPDFSPLFNNMVFLDCSLVNIVRAQKYCSEWGIKNVTFVRADATDLPFEDGVFDFVNEAGVIEHVADPERLVAEAIRVTSPRGVYVCISPNRFCITPEPHFRLACFGFFPTAVRGKLREVGVSS
jgi:hypothetical protein